MNWNHYPQLKPKHIEPIFSRFDAVNFAALQGSVLPYGKGRSYSDCCLNDSNIILAAAGLNRFLQFDTNKGLLTCEAGITLAEILNVTVPQGWFLPVLPGTSHVTVGGAIANDIHGKNHVTAGTWGKHIVELELLRSDGVKLICSLQHNKELFQASIGGLGLTGLILSATIQLKKIHNPYLDVLEEKFYSLADFLDLNEKRMHEYEYTVAWVDPYHARGHYLSAKHNDDKRLTLPNNLTSRRLSVPIYGTHWLFNPLAIKFFNQWHFHKMRGKRIEKISHYQPFFFPLDGLENWNRIYGRAGFLQYQCVLPTATSYQSVKDFFSVIQRAKQKTTLAVIKSFGELASPGILSFPKAGITLAMDFANPNEELLKLFNELDALVVHYQGCINPSKDARMSASTFKQVFPKWQEFAIFKDEKFSSSFWRRVMEIKI
jgi:FAD/FMN-containing dehydrogenase